MKEHGLSEADVRAARAGEAVEALTEQQHALIHFARRVVDAGPKAIDAEDIAALRAVGLDDPTIVEAVSIVMLSALTNTLADTFKFDQDLERLGMAPLYF